MSVANTDVDICAGHGGPNVVYVEGAIKRGGERVNTQDHHVLCILYYDYNICLWNVFYPNYNIGSLEVTSVISRNIQ